MNPPCFAEQNATAFAGAEDFTPCFAEQNTTAFAGAEDFTPCFAEQNANPLVSRGFYSLFIQMLKNIVYVYFLRSKLLASFMPIVWNIWNKITSKITVTIMISVCHLV